MVLPLVADVALRLLLEATGITLLSDLTAVLSLAKSNCLTAVARIVVKCLLGHGICKLLMSCRGQRLADLTSWTHCLGVLSPVLGVLLSAPGPASLTQV